MMLVAGRSEDFMVSIGSSHCLNSSLTSHKRDTQGTWGIEYCRIIV